MEYFGLPVECLKFLELNKDKIVCLNNSPSEVENVTFFSTDELVMDFQIIHTSEYFHNYGDFNEDPNLRYSFPAVNLIKSDADDNYSSDGLLVWLPDLKCFGSFDIDHCIGYVFKNALWNELESTLGTSINTQWEPEKSQGILFKPWDEQEFEIDFSKFLKELDE